jgi:hypothetical protein
VVGLALSRISDPSLNGKEWQRVPRKGQWPCRWSDRDNRCNLRRTKRGGGVGATCTIAVSRGDSFALLWQ